MREDELNSSPLFEALWRRKHRYAQKLLAAGTAPNQFDACGHTPLMVAVSNCSLKMVQELLQMGIDPNIQDQDGHTALRMACSHLASSEGVEMVHLLLDAGADITIPDKRGFTAADSLLMVALRVVHLPHNVMVNRFHFDFLHACISGNLPHLESIDYSMIPQRILNHALVDCAFYGFTGCCVLLISKGANPNGYNIAGSYPLVKAIQGQQFNTARQLIDCGALVNGPATLDDQGDNLPLVMACQLDESYHKDPRQKNFHLVTRRMVSLLLHKGAAPNARRSDGFTGLRQAVLCSCDLGLIRILLEHGADPLLKDCYGLSPLEHAEQICKQDAVNLLRLHSNTPAPPVLKRTS